MRQIATVALLMLVFWASAASADPVRPAGPLPVRITGTLLPFEEQSREDLVTVKVFVKGQPWLLRIGEVEGMTTSEREWAVKRDILLRQVRFYGPEELVEELRKPEIVGKILTIEGRLDVRQNRFLVTAVKEVKVDELQNSEGQ